MVGGGELARPGGRVVTWAEWGDPDGRPILRIHGTPGSRLTRNPVDPEAFARAGAHVVTFDRPGYGGSTPHRDRTILTAADDGIALADELGWERFSVLGVSGGGPHALAMGARAPDRIHRLGVAVGGTPEEMVDDEDLIAFNREAKRRVLEEGRTSLEEFLAEPAALMMGDPVGTLAGAMEDAPAADRAMLERPEVRDALAESLREAFRNGPAGWFDDSWCLSNDWGFELSNVAVPVWLWYGELDRNVPLSAARRMADQLQVSAFTVIPDVGHFGWLAKEETVLRTLLDGSA
jgi:pimeloyl-ACP methyl ester carboxylesterase